MCILIIFKQAHCLNHSDMNNMYLSALTYVLSMADYIRNDSRGNKNNNAVQIVQPGRISLVDWCICFVWWPVLLARPGESHSSAKKGTSAQYLLDLRYIFVFR